jgi:phage-related protein
MSEVAEFDYFSSMNTYLMEINNTLAEVKDLISTSMQSASQATSPTSPSSKNTKQMENPLLKIGQLIKTTFKSALGPVALAAAALSAFADPLMLIIDPISMMGDILGTILYPVLEPLSNRLYEAAGYLSDLMTAIEPYAPVIEYVSGIITDFLIEVLLNKFVFVFNYIKAFVEAIINIVILLVQLVKGDLEPSEFIAKVWEVIKKLFNDIVEAFKTYFGDLWATIANLLDEFGENIGNWFRDLPSKIVSKLNEGWDNAEDWWNDLWRKK